MDNNSVYALYQDILRDLYGQFGSELDESVTTDSKVVAAQQLKNSFVKKLELTNADAEQLAIDKFLECNDLCSSWTPNFGDMNYLIAQEVRYEMTRITQGIYDKITDVNLHIKDAGFGGGANIGACGPTFYQKLFAGAVSAPNRLVLHLYKDWVESAPSTRSAERVREARFGPIEINECVVLHTVPKTVQIARTICVETTLGMFYQKIVDKYIRRRLITEFDIDLRRQQARNRDLAMRGSIDGSIATIDLSSASDTISRNMLAWTCWPGFVQMLYSLTGKFIDCHGYKTPLNMVSSMGNGYTFSLQTLLFATITTCTMRVMGHKPTSANFGVNGDDIICPSVCSEKVQEMLRWFGFTPNPEKSFSSGLFRESCGLDAFNGVNVRGIYVKRLRTNSDLYSIFNRLTLWSAYHNIPLNRTLEHCLLLARRNKWMNTVPPSAPITSGFRIPKTALNRVPKKYIEYTSRRAEWRVRKWMSGQWDYDVIFDKWGDKLLINPVGFALSVLREMDFGARKGISEILDVHKRVGATVDEPSEFCLPKRSQSRVKSFEKFVDISDWDIGINILEFQPSEAASEYNPCVMRMDPGQISRWIVIVSVAFALLAQA